MRGCFCRSFLFAILLVISVDAAPPKIIAHRGVSKEAPENTLSAFAKAIPLGVDAIEFDVHLTKDNVPIVIHDGKFGRTADRGYLQRTTSLFLEQVKALDVGSWYDPFYIGERIPTLDEVLDLVQGSVRLMVEIKKDNSPAHQIVQAVITSLKKAKGPVVIGSFDPLIIEEVLRTAPEYPVIGIVEELDMLDKFKALSVKQIAIWYDLLSAELIQQFHDQEIEVWTFTVDNPGLAKFLVSINIDGIITNNPRAIKKALEIGSQETGAGSQENGLNGLSGHSLKSN